MDEVISRQQRNAAGMSRKMALALLADGVALYAVLMLSDIHINAVALTIFTMIALCLLRLPVAVALLSAALLGGLHAGLGMEGSITAFNDHLLIGAQVGMTYIMVGAFAVALARSGLLELLAEKISGCLGSDITATGKRVKWTLFLIFIAASLMSQNLVPVHIAFIPILIPPLLGVINRLRLDRRAVACILACSISASYLLLPIGFGAIYLDEILLKNVNDIGAPLGLTATAGMAPKAMFMPVMGIVAGMLVAVFITYRKPRDYQTIEWCDTPADVPTRQLNLGQLLATLAAIAIALVFQLMFDSLLVGAMIGL